MRTAIDFGRLGLRVMLALIAWSFSMLAPAAAKDSTLAERITRLEPHMSVFQPRGDGPFPVVLMLPGCGGRQPFLNNWAEHVVREGAVAVIVDSHKMRGIGRLAALSTVCTGAQMQGRERAGDLYAAYAWARTQPWADRERIIAAGWSHGGWTILDSLALRSGPEMRRATGITDLPDEPLEGIAGAFLLYPYVGVASLGSRPWRQTPPTVAIVCGQDYMVGTDTPLNALRRLRDHGAPLEITVFPNGTHAFDEPEARDLRVRYDADLVRRSQNLLGGLIERVRRPIEAEAS